MAANIPSTLEEARKHPGFREISEQEFKEFSKNFGDSIQSFSLINCGDPANDQKLCQQTGCYKGQQVFVYCENMTCQKKVIVDC